MELSDPKGIIFAAMLVPKIETIQVNAERKTANRVLEDQYLSNIAPSKSQGFQRSRFQEWLIALVAKIPKDAESVTARGFEMSCDHCAPVFVRDQRAMSGWLVMRVAVLPMPELIAYITNQPLFPLMVLEYSGPSWPFVLTMQKMKRPQTAGRMMMDLNQKKARSW